MFEVLTTEWIGDERTKKFILMGNPYPTIAVSLLYLVLVDRGIKIMEGRNPFILRTPMIIYNFSMVILNLCIFIDGGRFGWFGGYNWRCAPNDPEITPQNLGMINICWWFYFSKFIELLDTTFFILRKKDNQITFLHLIHHSLLPVSCWFTVKYTPVGHSTFMGFTNSFVHVLMYSYYGLAAIETPKTQMITSKVKKHLTKIQMIQFILMISHSLQLLFTDCNFPKWCAWFNMAHGALFLGLFYNFYRKYDDKKIVHHKKHDTHDHEDLKQKLSAGS